MEGEVFINMQQISLYSATFDKFEGFVPLNPELLTDKFIHDAVNRAFYLKAILLKFPELQGEYSINAIEGVIEAMEGAQDVVDNIQGEDPDEHYKWKMEILEHFREAKKYVKQI